MKPAVALLFALAAAAHAAPPPVAPAPPATNRAVKCGRVYQDRPCADGQGRMIGNTAAQKAMASRAPVDAACAKRGTDAAAVIDGRASGRSQDEALAGTVSQAQKRLIAQVYAASGNAAEQRTAIEQQCMADRQRLARSANSPGKP